MGMYPEGITARPDLLEVLGLASAPDDFDSFEGLTVEGLQRLIDLMPAEWIEEGHEAAPSVGELREIGKEFLAVMFSGTILGPGMGHERIYIDGIDVPENLSKSEFVRLLEMTGYPDAELSETRFEWD